MRRARGRRSAAPLLLVALAGLAVAGAGCGPAPEVSEPAPLIASGVHSSLGREADPPAEEGAFAPSLWADERGLLLTWIEPLGEERSDGHRVRFSSLEAGVWTQPVTIVEGTELFANWADFPSPARAADGTTYVHWLAKTADETYAYSIYLASSVDGGANWTEVGPLNDDQTDTEHGFVSWVREGEGLRAFWLDGREMASDGPMTLRTAGISGPGGRVEASELLDDRVCECCSTDAAVSSSGAYAVYRDRSREEIRDIYQARWAQGAWEPARLVAADGWSIEGCPVNGPETDAEGDSVVTAWFTAAGDQAQVRVSMSHDGGATYEPAVVVDDEGPLGRVDVVADGHGGGLVSWLGRAEGEGVIRIARISAAGELGEVQVLARTSESRASGFPRLAKLGSSLFVAWVEMGEARESALRVREIALSEIS